MSKRDEMLGWIDEICRRRGGCSIDKLAADVGVVPSTIRRFVNGDTPLMTSTTVARIEAATGISFAFRLDQQERALIAIFRTLTGEQRRDLVAQARAIAPAINKDEVEVLDISAAKIVYRGPDRRRAGLHDYPGMERRRPGRYQVTKL